MSRTLFFLKCLLGALRLVVSLEIYHYPCSSIAATTFVALWGATPMSTSTLVASFAFGPSPSSWRTEDNPTLGKIHASALSHSARRFLRRVAGLEQANPAQGRQVLRKRSLPTP
jgi:hypothetical protein